MLGQQSNYFYIIVYYYVLWTKMALPIRNSSIQDNDITDYILEKENILKKTELRLFLFLNLGNSTAILQLSCVIFI